MIFNYKIVIKTKDRVNKFFKKTYTKIIKKYDFDETMVHLFVSNDTDFNNYSKNYPRCKIIKGPKGIAGIDNFIVDYFDEGEIYIYMNDDVSGIYEATSKKELKEVEDLKGLLNKLIKECQSNGYTYGGFGPVCNPYFMYGQKPINKGFSLVMDPLSICINNKDVRITEIPVTKPNGKIFIGDFSDVEKCIQHYKSKGGIIRFNHYAPKVEYYGKQGGIQGRDPYTEKYVAEFMFNKYPEYISSINFKKNGNTSLRLKKKPLFKKPILKNWVISLDNELGKSRRKRINYLYKWIKGIDGKNCHQWIKDKMISMPSIKNNTLNGKLGCFATYIYIFRKIVDEKINNVIILEDDCVQVRPISIKELGNEPIFLNGVFHHPKNYQKTTEKWLSELKDFKHGINTIDYNKFRITGTIGIYFPKWEQVKKILCDILNLKKVRSIDNCMINLKSIKKFYYPSIFIHDDKNKSNIKKGGYGYIKNYVIQKNPDKNT